MASKDEQSRAIDPVPVARAREQWPALRRGGQWLVWVLACAGAGVAARTAGQFANVMLLGLAFGAAQGVVLGRQHPQAGIDPRVLWVVVSTIGGVVGFVLGGTAASMVGEGLGLRGNHIPAVAYGVALWTAIGAAQWLVLRQSVRNFGWWVPASAVGGVAFAVAEIVISMAVGFPAAEAAPYGAVTGACYGAVTGVALAWLFPNGAVTRQVWRAAIPLVVAGLLIVRVTATRDVCDADEQAVLAEFPQYGGVQVAPRTDEAGACALSYATQDTVEKVTAYFTNQLAAHGWTIEPQRNRSEFGGELSAHRRGVRYAIFYASNASHTPPQPGVRLDIQVRKP